MRLVILQTTCLLLFVCLWRTRADPVGVLEGQVKDASGAIVSAAELTVTNRQTGFHAVQRSADDGSFHFSSLPAGEYDLRVGAEASLPSQPR